jgi:hypothetical protein
MGFPEVLCVPALHNTTKRGRPGGAAPSAGKAQVWHMSIRRRRQAALWTLVILASLILTAAGLAMTFALIRTPESFAREGPGHALIFAGAVASAAAAVWARRSDLGWPVVLAVAGPALLA